MSAEEGQKADAAEAPAAGGEEAGQPLAHALFGRRPGEQAREHKFWNTQPVPQLDDPSSDEANGPIDAAKRPSDVRQDPFPLPDAFAWRSMDVLDAGEAEQVYTLLTENYVEDDDAMFRFDYGADFLRWALTPPGYLKEWHLGVEVKANKKLVGFISAIPATMVVHGKEQAMVEINFLCVHKKLRDKRLAPVLIKEITRRVNVRDLWQAAYTAGVLLPRPVSQCRYFHRALNPKKLLDVRFSSLGPRMTVSRTVKFYELPTEPTLPGLRPMEAKDVPAVVELLAGYLKQFSLHPHFSPDELAHWMLPRPEVVYSYVREQPSGRVTDVLSFYNLPSSVLGNPKHSTLRAAYSFWNVATSCTLTELMHNGLIFAKKENFDVYNALNLMQNDSFLKTLKFVAGDGFLHYYLYNWRCPAIKPNEVGLVLL